MAIRISDDLVRWTEKNARELGITEVDWLLAKITEGYLYDLTHNQDKIPRERYGYDA